MRENNEMNEISHVPAPASRVAGNSNPSDSGDPPSQWLAGASYPAGTKIWCATLGGEDAWTTDLKLATRYDSKSSAHMAACPLADDVAAPFRVRADA